MEDKNTSYENNLDIKRQKEEGILDFFDKLPTWLRWLIFLPAAFLGYIIIYYIAYLGWYWFSGEAFTNGYVGQSLQTVVFVVVPLIIIQSCVPKKKFIITIIFSSLYIILGIVNITIAIYLRPYSMTLDYFFSSILPGILTVVVAVIMIVLLVKMKYET